MRYCIRVLNKLLVTLPRLSIWTQYKGLSFSYDSEYHKNKYDCTKPLNVYLFEMTATTFSKNLKGKMHDAEGEHQKHEDNGYIELKKKDLKA